MISFVSSLELTVKICVHVCVYERECCLCIWEMWYKDKGSGWCSAGMHLYSQLDYKLYENIPDRLINSHHPGLATHSLASVPHYPNVPAPGSSSKTMTLWYSDELVTPGSPDCPQNLPPWYNWRWFWVVAVYVSWLVGWFSHYVMSDSWDPMDCSLPGSSVHGILQVRILEWVAISFSMCRSDCWLNNLNIISGKIIKIVQLKYHVCEDY